MQLTRLWLATLTRDVRNAGTNSLVSLVINNGGSDLLNEEFPNHVFRRANANLFEIDVRDKGIDPETLQPSSVRVEIQEDNAWRPEHIAVWGESVSALFGAASVPIALEVDRGTQISGEPSEGDASLPVRLVAKGNRDMPINRLFLFVTTAGPFGVPPIGRQGTDSPIEIQIVSEGRLVVLSEIRDTTQDDLEENGANIYTASVFTPFTRRSLDSRSITLRLKGLDTWRPSRLFLFGADDATARPERLVPLVHLPAWPFGPMEPLSTTGTAEVTLPLAADHSAPSDGVVVSALESLASTQGRAIELLETLAAAR